MDKREREAWVFCLKAGDEVAVSSGYGESAIHSIRTVKRVTAKQVLLDDHHETRVDRDTGRIRGGARRYIWPVTQEVRDKMEHARLTNWLSHTAPGGSNGWKAPPLPVLRAMKAAYEEATAKLAQEA